jgi:hypothetical protein
MTGDPVEPRRRSRSTQPAIERTRAIEPEQAILARAHKRMLEQRQQRERGEALRRRLGQRQQQRPWW